MAQNAKPTMGRASATGSKGEHIFEGLFSQPYWIVRKQSPDVFIDYLVEVVEQGEPTGRQFAAQVKGTQARKGGPAHLKYSAKAKQVRYWLNDCLHPAFVFLIDVETGEGHWLFAQQFAKEQIAASALKTQTKITLRFAPEDSSADMDRFKAALQNAETYVRNLHPGSAKAAILAEKKNLEELYPGTKVSISATNQFLKYQISQTAPSAAGMKIKFQNPEHAAAVKSFLETGQSFEAKATDIQTEDSPALAKLLQELGDSTIKIQTAHKVKGCVQFTFKASSASSTVIQLDGEWLLAPKRTVFHGQLAESPLFIEYIREIAGSDAAQHVRIAFRFRFKEWQGQAIQALAYLTELWDLVRCSEFQTRCLIRGNQLWPRESISICEPGVAHVVDALDWLRQSSGAAKFLGINPALPKPETINTNSTESKNLQLLFKLLGSGVHEQTNVGEVVGFSGEREPGEPTMAVGKRELTVNWTEAFREIDFFGVKIPFGPLIHTWTDLELVGTRPVNEVRDEMTFRGGSQSVWRIEYQRPEATQTTHR